MRGERRALSAAASASAGSAPRAGGTGWTEALIAQIEADRALAKAGEWTPAVADSATAASMATDAALDAVNSYGYQIGDIYKLALRDDPTAYATMMGAKLAEMRAELIKARKVLDEMSTQLRPKQVRETRELTYRMIEASIAHWDEIIKSLREGPPGAEQEAPGLTPEELERLRR